MPLTPETDLYGMTAAQWYARGVPLDIIQEVYDGEYSEEAPMTPPTATVAPDRSLLGDLGAEFSRGFLQNLSGKASTVGAEETAGSIKRAADAINTDPEFARQMALTKDMSLGESMAYLIANPKFTAQLTAQTAGQFTPELIAMFPVLRGLQVLGMGAKAAGITGAAVAGVGSATTSAGLEAQQILTDLTGEADPVKQRQMIEADPALFDAVWEVATRRGVADGLAAALGVGIAGKVAPAVGAKLLSLKGAGSEALAQMGVGAGAELGAQEATLRGTPFDVAAEIVLEGISGPAEAIVQRAVRGEKVLEGKEKAEDPETGFEDITPEEGSTPRTPSGVSVSKTPEERIAAQEKRVLSKVEKATLSGTYDQRLKRLAQQKYTDLSTEAEKRKVSPFTLNAKGKEIRKTKIDLAKDILAAEDVQPTATINRAPKFAREEAPVNTTPVLPKELAGAKPRFRTSELQFEQDRDRALYIVSQAKKSSRDADYRSWLKDSFGWDDARIDAEAKALRPRVAATKPDENGVMRVASVVAPTVRPVSPLTNKLRQVGLNPNIQVDAKAEQRIIENIVAVKDKQQPLHKRNAAASKLFTELNGVGLFDTVSGKVDQQRAARQFVKEHFNDIDPKTLDAVAAMEPKVQAALMREASEDVISGSRPSPQTVPPFVSKASEAVGEQPTSPGVEPRVEPQTDEQVAQRVADAEAAYDFSVFSSPEYQDFQKIVENSTKAPNNIYGFDWGKSKTSLAALNWGRLTFNSVTQLARQFPVFNRSFWAFDKKQNFVREYNNAMQGRLRNIVTTFGDEAVNKALAVMDYMSSPMNPTVQKPEFAADGRLRFVNEAGRTMLADIATTNAFKELQKFNLEMMDLSKSLLTTKLQLAGVDVKPGQSLIEVKERNIGREKPVQDVIDEAISVEAQIEGIKRNTRGVYYPHSMRKGEYAVTLYDKQGNLKFIRPIEKGLFKDSYSDRDLEAAIQEATEYMARTGETWQTFSKGDFRSVKPFVMNANNAKAYLRRGGSTPQLNEALASMLTMNNVPAKVIDEIVSSLGAKKDIEKLYAGYRERGNYWGYDREARIAVLSESLASKAYMGSNFAFNSYVNQLVAEDRAKALSAGTPMQAIQKFDNYVDANQSYGEQHAGLRALAYGWFMLGNISSAGMQLFTPVLITVPLMKRYAPASEMLKWGNGRAMVQVVQDLISNMSSDMRGLTAQQKADKFLKNSVRYVGKDWSADERAMLVNLDRRGYLSESQQTDIDSAVSSEFRNDTLGQKIGNTKIGRGLSNLVPVAERAARMTSFHAIYKMMQNPRTYDNFLSAKAKEQDPLWQSFLDAEYNGTPSVEAAVAFLMTEYHGFYGKVNRPAFLNTLVGSVAFPLTPYVIAMCELLGRTMISNGRINPEGLKALAVLAATAWAIGGIQGIPVYQPLDWLTKFLTSTFGKPTDGMGFVEDTLKSMGFDEKAQSFIVEGPFARATGASIGPRISINPPVTGLLTKIIDPTFQSGPVEYMGAVGSIAQPPIDFVKAVSQGADPMSAAAKTAIDMMPAAPKNLVKSAQLAAGEMRTAAGDKLALAPGEVSPITKEESPVTYRDVALQAMGFTPLSVNRLRRERMEARQDALGPGARGTAIAREAAKIVYDNRSGKLSREEAAKKLAEKSLEYVRLYNEFSPETPTKEAMGRFNRSVKEMSVRELDPKAGVIESIPKAKRERIVPEIFDLETEDEAVVE